MVEIYLFINPLGSICLDIEKKILDFIDTENSKIQLRLLPLINFHTVSELMTLYKIPHNNLDARNQLFEDGYAATLDFKALQLQGNRIGRQFLMELQEAVAVKGIPYSGKLTRKILKSLDVDLKTFEADRMSSLTKDAFNSDQQVAHEMQIQMHPSAVVFNYACDQDFGILVEGCSSVELLKNLCKTDEESCQLYVGNHPHIKHANKNNFYLI